MAGQTGASKETRGTYGSRAPAERSGCGSPTNRAMSEFEDDDAFLDVTCVQMEPGSPDGEENAASPENFGADPLRTLGEILAYCQVMYGAIQKLDAKFELLKTSVTTFPQVDHATPSRGPPPSHRGHAPELNNPSHAESFQLKVEPPGAPSYLQPLEQGPASPTIPAPSEGEKDPGIRPLLDNLTQAQVYDQPQAPPRINTETVSQPNSKEGRGHALGNASGTASEHVGRCQPNTSHTVTETLSPQRWSTPGQRPPPPHTTAGNTGNRKFVLPNSFLRKAGTMARPTSAARFLMRSVFSHHELLHGNTRGDLNRGLRRLDPARLDAIREWLQRRYPRHELHDTGKDWRACLAVMNKTTRYIRLMDRTRGLNTDTGPIQDVDAESSGPITDEESKLTAEIDVELSDSEADHPRQQRAPPSTLRGGAAGRRATDTGAVSNQEPLVFLGSAGRGVKVPQAALFGAWQRPRPPLVARYLIRFMFSEDVLVHSNVYGNTEHGIQPLDHNKISALREHLCERFHWLQLQEDGPDWKACVDAINSCIRKTRHKLKKSRR